MPYRGGTAPYHAAMTISRDYQRDWPAYFDAVREQPPRETCLRALDAFERDNRALSNPVAIDIACGEGRDTRAILARAPGWRVWAVDSSTEGLTRLRSAVRESDRPRVETVVLAMEEIPSHAARLPGRADFINASFALPFCDENGFPALWAWIRATVAPGGRFAGQFFGDRDEWAPVNPRRHHTRDQVLSLLGGFSVEHFDEVEKDGLDAMGGTKHHHVFHVVAGRPV